MSLLFSLQLIQGETLDGAPNGQSAIISSDAKLKTIFEDAVFTEGPAVALDGTVFFSDITRTSLTNNQAGHIWKHDPSTGKTSVFRSPSGMTNGIIFDLKGEMVVAEGADHGGRRITRTDLATGKSEILAGLYNGRPFNSPNDLTIDDQGRIYFTDPRYFGYEAVDQPIMGVYRIDPDRSIHLVISDAGKPNGIAVSPDQKTLYIACYDNGRMGSLPEGMRARRGRMAILAYDLRPNGTAEFRSVLVDYPDGGGPDGMALDVDGNIYMGGNFQPRGVRVYSSKGEQLGFVATPSVARNVSFGRGLTAKTLYIAAGGGLYSIQVQKRGYHPVAAVQQSQ